MVLFVGSIFSVAVWCVAIPQFIIIITLSRHKSSGRQRHRILQNADPRGIAGSQAGLRWMGWKG